MDREEGGHGARECEEGGKEAGGGATSGGRRGGKVAEVNGWAGTALKFSEDGRDLATKCGVVKRGWSWRGGKGGWTQARDVAGELGDAVSGNARKDRGREVAALELAG